MILNKKLNHIQRSIVQHNKVVSNNKNEPTIAVMTRNKYCDEGTIKASFNIRNVTQNGYVGIAFAYQDELNYLSFEVGVFNCLEKIQCRIRQMVKGQWTILKRNENCCITKNEWWSVHIHIRDKHHLRVWYGPDKNYPDMNEVFKIKTQKPIEGGKIGLLQFKNTGAFTNIQMMPNSDYITRYTLDKLDNYEYTGKCEINEFDDICDECGKSNEGLKLVTDDSRPTNLMKEFFINQKEIHNQQKQKNKPKKPKFKTCKENQNSTVITVKQIQNLSDKIQQQVMHSDRQSDNPIAQI